MTRRATAILRHGDWDPAQAAEEITLDYDRRHRRRLRLSTTAGGEVLLDLAEATHIKDGDALVLEDGATIAVRAAPEALLDISAPDADTLARLAWHLGNRHLAVQFLPGVLRILDDYVIAEMLARMGAAVTKLHGPFDPESGAYHHG